MKNTKISNGVKLKNAIFPVLVAIVLVISGCTKDQEPTTDQTNINQATSTPQNNWEQNMTALSFGDLTVGQKVMVMGSQESDGSVAATSIIIDNGQGQNFMPPQATSTEGQDRPFAERPDFGNQRPMGQRPVGPQSGQTFARINGEIIGLEEGMITLKIEDGGSKLIFISDQTKILQPNQAE